MSRDIAAAVCVLAILIEPALAATCAMDRTTFVDKHTKAEFVAERAAVAYRYVCPNRRADGRVFSRAQKRLERDCQGPYGETYLLGTLAGRKVIAVYTVEKAAPCCVWRSYEADGKEMRGKKLTWLTGADVPTVEIGSEWLTIGPDNPPWPPDKGPLSGGVYVPAVCRAN